MAAELDAALLELRRQVDPTPVFDQLEQAAEREGRRAALGAAYGALASSDSLATVPERVRLELWLRAARLSQLDAAARQELAERYASAARSGSTERERRLLEQALATFEEVGAGDAATRVLSDRLARLPAPPAKEAALLLAVTARGNDSEAALATLVERWLREGRAVDGVAKLPACVADFQSDAAVDLLERLFTAAGSTASYAELLERRATRAPSPLARARGLEQLAKFGLDSGSDAVASDAYARAAAAYEAADEPEDAERSYQQALTISPDHLPAAKRLVWLRSRAGDFAAAAAAFSTVLRLEADNRKACELLLSIVDHAEGAGAATEYAELADDVSWRLAEDDRELQQRLLRASVRLLQAETRYDEAAELYRRMIADHPTAEDLDAYQALIDSHPVADWRSAQQRWLFGWQEHHSADRASVLLSWARFEERELGDPVLALAVLERAAELAPERPEIWTNLTRLRLAAGDGAGAVSASHELLRLGHEPDSSLLELLLEHEPGARWALDRVKLILSAEARWTELFELYDRAIEASADESERASLLNEAAIAARDVAQDPEQATRYWEGYFALVPADLRADQALERLYEQAGDQRALLGHLKRRALDSTPSEPARLSQRIIRLALEVGALDDALSAIEALPSDAPDAAPPLLELVFERSRELGWGDEVRAAGKRAAQLLRANYLERGEADAAARLLKAELELELETLDRNQLLAELSRLSETALDDLTGAFEAQRELFLSTRGSAERERLEALSRACDGWTELCETLALAAEVDPVLENKQQLLRRAAELAGGEARDPGLATRLYGQMFQLYPEGAFASFQAMEDERGEQPEAFEALSRLLEASGQFAQLAELLTRRAERNRDPSLFSKLGRLHADLGDQARAIDAHLRACDARSASQVFLRQPSVFGDDSRGALDLAARLHAAGLTEGSLLVLRHQLAFYEGRTPPERKPVVLELVRLLEESGESEAARGELSEAARHFPTDSQVQHACAKSAASMRDWDTAEQYYRTLLLLLHRRDGGSTRLRQAAIYVELAAIKRLRDEGAAGEELVESGFEAALGSAPDLAALAEALLEHGMHDAAERAVYELLKLARDLPTAARALACLAELAQSQRAPAELMARAAELAERIATRYSELSEPAERSRLLAACIGLLPLEKAERLLREAAAELSPEHAVAARLEVSRRLLDCGQDAARARAISELQALLALPAAEAEAWPLLVRGLRAGSRAEELAIALEARLERAPTDLHALRAALDLSLEKGDLATALDFHERLSQAGHPRDAQLSDQLIRVCLEQSEPRTAVRVLRRDAAREREPEARAQRLVEAAQLAFDQGDVAEACAAASDARSADPSSAESVLLSAKLARAQGRHADALAWLSDYAESSHRRRGPGLVEVLKRAGELHLEQDELSEALPRLLEAHRMDERDLETALLLGLLAVDLDRLDIADAALRAVIARRETGNRDSARSPHIAQGYFQLARIELHHGKKINAKRMALRAIEENPNLASAHRLLSELGPH